MKCDKCGKDSYVMYLTPNFETICPECEEKEHKKDLKTKWERIKERMRKRYGDRR